MGEFFNRAESPELLIDYSPIRRHYTEKTKSLEDQLNAVKLRMAEMEKALHRLMERRIEMCVGNMLIQVAKSVVPRDSGASTHVLAQSMAAMQDKDLRSAEIPSKYWPVFRSLSKHVESRNSAAHEPDYEFASLLKEPGMENHYAKWAPLFQRAYGKSVEEFVESVDDCWVEMNSTISI